MRRRSLPGFRLGLVALVALAGVWPLLGGALARGTDAFFRYAEIMPVAQAWQMAQTAEFCGKSPTRADDGDAAPAAQRAPMEVKLLLATDAPIAVVSVPKAAFPPPTGEVGAASRASAPEPPPPRV